MYLLMEVRQRESEIQFPVMAGARTIVQQWQQAAAQFLSTVLECVEQATLQVVVILLLEVEM
jgi:hypothetical protein